MGINDELDAIREERRLRRRFPGRKKPRGALQRHAADGKKLAEEVSVSLPNSLFGHDLDEQEGPGNHTEVGSAQPDEAVPDPVGAKRERAGERIPRDLGELVGEYGGYIQFLVSNAEVWDVEDVSMDIVLQMEVRGFIRNYRAHLGSFRNSVKAFVLSEVRTHLRRQRRLLDLRRRLRDAPSRRLQEAESSDPFYMEPALAEIEMQMVIEQVNVSPTRTGSILAVCLEVSIETGSRITGAELGRRMDVSAQAGSGYLRSLNEGDVRDLLREGRWG